MRVLILLALLGSALAVPRTVQRIVGGSATTIDNYPYMSNMQYCFFSSFCMQYCGGSLLTNNLVLSAAHCYEGDPASSWRVVLGTSFASTGGTTHPVSRIVMHENYDTPVLSNDIALLFLSTNAVFSTTIQPARIPATNFNVADGSLVTSIGWGALYSNGPAPEQLQHVDTYVINQELCAERYAYLKSLPGYSRWPDVDDGMMCAGIQDVGGKDTCQGDSGGPMAYEGDIIVGITSWGFGCADSFYPGVVARVSYYSNWIVANA